MNQKMIIELIKKTFNIPTIYDEEIDKFIMRIDNKFMRLPYRNLPWKNLKKVIENKLKNECSICYEKMKISVSCSTCFNSWCEDCANKLDVCPFCRYDFCG